MDIKDPPLGLSGISKVRARPFLAAAIIATHSTLLIWGTARHSPTYNEVAHLVAGISYWRHGSFKVYRVNPPLTRLTPAAAVLLLGPQTDWKRFYDWPAARPEFELGKDFVAANGVRSLWLYTVARCAMMPVSWLGAYVCFRWAGDLYGERSGILAVTLWCFCPNILAHAELVTPDVGATAFGVAAGYAFWRWLQAPTFLRASVAGTALGLAELTKFTWLMLFALWPAVWVANRLRCPHARRDLRRWSLESIQILFIIIGLAIYVINFGYGFEKTCRPLRAFKFVSRSLAVTRTVDGTTLATPGTNRFADAWCGPIPVPLPANYVTGIDLQKSDLESYSSPSYLRGTFRRGGWWYYYLYGLTIKVPLGTWILLLLSVAASFVQRKRTDVGRSPLALVAPVAAVLAMASSQTSGFSAHLRYVLPIFPFVFIYISRVAGLYRQTTLRWIVKVALTWSVASSLWIYPHSLSYFNELVGGPNGGAAHLIDSNIDWGQDLLFLRAWLRAHPDARPLKLAYFGYFDPKHVGTEYRAPFPANDPPSSPSPLAPGWYAISVNLVQGMTTTIPTGDGRWGMWTPQRASRFSALKPVARVGYSIYIYHVPPNAEAPSLSEIEANGTG